MTALGRRSFIPRREARSVYDRLYRLYRELHDTFGAVAGTRADLATLMKRLLSLRESVAGRPAEAGAAS
jgi:L-ribulokinase